MYTQEAINLLERTPNILKSKYQNEMGNFILDEQFVRDNIYIILKFIKENTSWFLIHEEDSYFLTDFLQ